MTYQHLTRDQRYQIGRLRKMNLSYRDIAPQVGCHHSAVGRELHRNRDAAGCDARKAHTQAVQRRHVTSSRPRIDPASWVAVEAKLIEDWSPEQIVGRGVAAISIEWIYEHIAKDRRAGGTLWHHRRHPQRTRHRIGSPRQRFSGRRISERPEPVEQRLQVGHWEADSVVGKGPPRIITLVERKSRYTRLQRVKDGKATTTRSAILRTLYPLRCCVQSLTYDNGSEFAEHAMIEMGLDAKAYFADPHSPWQRGTNENTNGLLRQYLPKGCSMADLTDEQLQIIEDKLNNRPRKALGFKTPAEVFFRSLKRRAS